MCARRGYNSTFTCVWQRERKRECVYVFERAKEIVGLGTAARGSRMGKNRNIPSGLAKCTSGTGSISLAAALV